MTSLSIVLGEVVYAYRSAGWNTQNWLSKSEHPDK
jgi:hypothetical protein